MRAAAAALLVVLAAALAAAAHDVLAWRDALHGSAVRVAHTWLPGDPVRSVFRLDDDLAVRRAVHSFRVAYTTGRGFDNGVTRTTRRSLAEVRLTDVAAHGAPADASQAGNLLGVLVVGGGRVTGGVTARHPPRAAVQAGVPRGTRDPAPRPQ